MSFLIHGLVEYGMLLSQFLLEVAVASSELGHLFFLSNLKPRVFDFMFFEV